jgi:hypothetical protein
MNKKKNTHAKSSKGQHRTPTKAKVGSVAMEKMSSADQFCLSRREPLVDDMIIYGFTSRSRIFHLYGDVTIAGEGLQNLGLCSAPWAFEQGGIFIVPYQL